MLRNLLATAMVLASSPVIAFDLEFIQASPSIYAHPHDLVLSPDRKFLYVADVNHDRIAVLDPASLALLGTFGENEIGAPHDVAFDATGRLLVADTNNSRIAIYAVNGATGNLIGELRGKFRRPEGVMAHPNGRIYATGASTGNIEAFEDGRSVAEAGGFSAPHDVAASPEGTVWVADADNDRLVELTADLNVRRTIGGGGYAFDGPRYLAFDRWARLYVADKYTHRIKVLGADKKIILTIGGNGKGPGRFDRPEGIAIDGTTVWFSDTYTDRIVRYRIVE